MRKGMTIALALIIAVSFSGCFYITIDEYYEIHQDVSQIVTISIYECTDGNTLSDEPVFVLDQLQNEQFVNDLEALPFKDSFLLILAAVDPSHSFGEYVVCIIYQDDSTEWISNRGYQVYNAEDGSSSGPHYSLDDKAWHEFLQKYFDIIL